MNAEFFSMLTTLDAEIARQVAAEGCPRCGGPLHSGNYLRRPRGGALAAAGEACRIRHSLCCGREGCRKRALPPSLRFLGRRVYLEAVVLFAVVWAQEQSAAEAAVGADVPRSTLDRWIRWWRDEFPGTAMWTDLRARFVSPPPSEAELPESLVSRILRMVTAREDAFAGGPVAAVAGFVARLLAPATTNSVIGGSRFMRGVAEQMQAGLLAQKMETNGIPKPYIGGL